MAKLRRGFKKWAEEQALELRQALQLQPEEPLPVDKVAEHLKVSVISPKDIPGMPRDLLRQLLHTGQSHWSAVTLVLPQQIVIIQNTAHSSARQPSDVTHELAHLICKHEPAQIIRRPGFPFPLRDYDQAQEDEADWLGGCLLLLRPALLWAVKREMTDAEIAEYFGTSVALASYRRRMTGVDKQFLATQRLGAGRRIQ